MDLQVEQIYRLGIGSSAISRRAIFTVFVGVNSKSQIFCSLQNFFLFRFRIISAAQFFFAGVDKKNCNWIVFESVISKIARKAEDGLKAQLEFWQIKVLANKAAS